MVRTIIGSWHDQPTDWMKPFQLPILSNKNQSGLLQVTWSLTSQTPGSHSYSQQVASLVSALPLCNRAESKAVITFILDNIGYIKERLHTWATVSLWLKPYLAPIQYGINWLHHLTIPLFFLPSLYAILILFCFVFGNHSWQTEIEASG